MSVAGSGGGDTGKPKKPWGFAAMSEEKQREIASKGGRASHEKGRGHEWTPDEARKAGRKGGSISRGGKGRLPATTSDEGAPPSPVPDDRGGSPDPQFEK